MMVLHIVERCSKAPGGTQSILDAGGRGGGRGVVGLMELHIANPENTQARNFRPKKFPGIKISNPKKYKTSYINGFSGTHVADKKFE